MHEKPVALVTGANKGIGLQIAKDLSMHGLTVVIGSRSLKAGEFAAKSVGDDEHMKMQEYQAKELLAKLTSRRWPLPRSRPSSISMPS